VLTQGAAFLSAIALLLGLWAPAPATPTPNFGGQWTLDPAMSSSIGGGRGQGTGAGNQHGGGLGLGPSPSALTITQTATSITIEQKGSSVSKVVYVLDGQPHQGKLPAGGSTRPATLTSAWQGDRLVTTMSAEAPQGRGIVVYEEVRYLTPEGLLAVETRDSAGGNSRRVVYRRR
jgi:hypothetical protein